MTSGILKPVPLRYAALIGWYWNTEKTGLKWNVWNLRIEFSEKPYSREYMFIHSRTKFKDVFGSNIAIFITEWTFRRVGDRMD